MVKLVTQSAISTLLANRSTDSSSIIPEIVVQVVDLKQSGNRYLFSANDGETKLTAIIPTNQDTEVSLGKTKNLGLIRILDYTLQDIPQTSEKEIIVRKFEHVCALKMEIKSEHTGKFEAKPLNVYSRRRRKSDPKMGLIYDGFLKHCNPKGLEHVENPQPTGISPHARLGAKDNNLLSMHSKTYVDSICSDSLKNKRNLVKDDLYFNEASTEMAYLASRSATKDSMVNKECNNDVAIVCPSSHNVVVAASHLFKEAAGMGDVKIVERTRSRKRQHHSQNDTLTQLVLLFFLPEEIIVNILLRLPVRTLLQFKCVCKSWKTIISDPHFAKNQIPSSTEYPRLVCSVFGIANCKIVSYPLMPLLKNTSTAVKPVKPVILSSRYETTILGSCNGLLCLYENSHFRLWNPSIKLESKRSPTIVCFEHHFVTFRGFGYDQVNDSYKVLVVVHNQYNFKETVTIVYTFGENSWTTVHNFPCDHQCDSNKWLGKFVSGTLNWIVNKDFNSIRQDVIVSFDVEKQIYGEMLLPQHDGDNVRNPVLHVLSNCICVSFDHPKESHWVVWIMKNYRVVESWTKLKIIPQNKLTPDIRSRRSFDTLFILENCVILLTITNGKLVVYNLNNNGRLNYRKILGEASRNLHVYHESLVSPQL